MFPYGNIYDLNIKIHYRITIKDFFVRQHSYCRSCVQAFIFGPLYSDVSNVPNTFLSREPYVLWQWDLKIIKSYENGTNISKIGMLWKIIPMVGR